MASGQRVLSSYFSQSNNTKPAVTPKASSSGLSTEKPIDLTLSDSEPETREPPSKKTRIQNEESTQDTLTASSSSPPPADSLFSSTMSQKWSFTPTTSSLSKAKSNIMKSGADIQLQAFRKKMGGDIPKVTKKTQGKKRRRESTEVASDEGAAQELRSEQGEEDGSSELEEDAAGTTDRLSKFVGPKRSKATASSKSKISSNNTTKSITGKGRGSQKSEEVGPAGLKYTPLEKQASYFKNRTNIVRLIKARHTDS
ncbi:hypothetical protein RSOLAG1IB_00728 [Rhizoctonia solani AG-1 IB]|uniref:Uncharacterized protein n=1 Tax=Thanatephorus cucumeris (strain AG1-IB / isolate 7/3/14) TaxID=1108050 RepID=A0A0B7F5J9_THACB|nr:hypothetical protein RSOLAG1IB_00728 [Rhizoctonia solani AG-1 IB]